jgi:hypothetical protein
MIRKPPAGWQRLDEGAAVRTVRTAAAVAKGSARVARRGGHAARGLLCYFLAIVWGFTGISGGLATGSLPSIIGVGAMAAFMFWAGRRAFAKARETSG